MEYDVIDGEFPSHYKFSATSAYELPAPSSHISLNPNLKLSGVNNRHLFVYDFTVVI